MLNSIIKNIVLKIPDIRSEQFSGNEFANKFRNEFARNIQEAVGGSYSVKASVGAGNWADIFWLSILDPLITETTQDGIYPVFLFCADGSGVFLSLNQGTTLPLQKLGRKIAGEQAEEFRRICLQQLNLLSGWQQGEIALNAKTNLGRSYQKPNIAARFYATNAIPSDHELLSDLSEIMAAYKKISDAWVAGMFDLKNNSENKLEQSNKSELSALNKPFLLLAGISGTGKSRFVRKQAEAAGDGKTNFKLVCVRPDWHEPADLLGYVSRIGGQPEYVATDVLRFMAAAWREAFDGVDDAGLLARTDTLTPYWLCLDEMNLAPVEQYFADYLSVLETRQWDDGVYRCEPLLTPAVIAQLEDVGRLKLRKDLQLEAAEWDDLWRAFCTHGISLPPNLIVAGTVNMDETTHGFSRKVIDRAITLDFGEFFPNDFDTFFGSQPLPVALGYPRLTSVTQADFAAVAADNDGSKTVAFLKAVNAVLAGTPFELAYRALNELLLAVVLAKPADDKALQAVWDDFLMTKVLPRIDGDEERLAWRAANPENTDKTVLDGLLDTARSQLAAISTGEARPDLLRTAHDGQPLMVPCRSLKKLGWMQERLTANRFTSFWP